MMDLRHREAGRGRAERRRGRGSVVLLLLVAGLSGLGAARASDGEAEREAAARSADRTRPAVAARAAPRADGFYRGHLLPGLVRQFELLAPYEALPARPGRPAAHFVFEDASRLARRRAGSGAKRALKEFLAESTPVGRWIEKIELKRAGGTSGRTRTTRLGLAVRRGRPVVELRRAFGNGLLRSGVSIDGRVRVEYRGGRSVSAGLRADYDPRRGEFGLGCRVAF